MLLVIDVGNTNTKVGVCDDTRLLVSWSLTTRREQTADEYGLFVETLLRTRGVDTRDITGVAISNVVPQTQRALDDMAEKYFGATPITVDASLEAIPLAVDDPRSVGADRMRPPWPPSLSMARPSSWWISARPRGSTASTAAAASWAAPSRPASGSPPTRC